jgi:hypothetical protein
MREAKIEVNVITDDDLNNLEIAQRFRILLSTGVKCRGIVIESVKAFDRYSGNYPQDRKPQLQPQQEQPTGCATANSKKPNRNGH